MFEQSLIGRLLLSDTGSKVFTVIIVLMAVVIPALNLLVPPDSVFHISTYTVTLLGKYLCFALLALSAAESAA